ncbi:MAG: hypothetical protein AAF555_05070 [Verrucomicrobiota bacterium]
MNAATLLKRRHREEFPPCPFLPPIERVQTASFLRGMEGRGQAFFEAALGCGQSLWRQGLPAQAILMLDRAWSAEESVRLAPDRDPWQALAWLLGRPLPRGAFLGNPRRHFQHYATRMSGHRREIRVARAWGGWWLTGRWRPEFPIDEAQWDQERLVAPEEEVLAATLQDQGWPGEAECWERAMRGRV